MSKSIGNVFMLGEALERHGPETLLMYFCRRPLPPADGVRRGAPGRGARARRPASANTARGLVDGPSPAWSEPLKERFLDALANDFNTPRALAALAEWEREANRGERGTVGGDDLREMLDILGLASLMESGAQPISDEVAALRDARERARAQRDWAEADRLRDELRAMGWEVRDGPDGPELMPAA